MRTLLTRLLVAVAVAAVGVGSCDVARESLALPRFRPHRAFLASLDRRAAGCSPITAACACPPADSLPEKLPFCYLQDDRVVVHSRQKRPGVGCHDRAFVRDVAWVPEFPRDERLGMTWVGGARRVSPVWVQVELKPCLD